MLSLISNFVRQIQIKVDQGHWKEEVRWHVNRSWIKNMLLSGVSEEMDFVDGFTIVVEFADDLR